MIRPIPQEEHAIIQETILLSIVITKQEVHSLSNEHKYAVYARFGNLSQADEQTEKKLEAVRLLQEIGCKVAVAPVNFQRDHESVRQIPVLVGFSATDPAVDKARALLSKDLTLVITEIQR